METPQCGNDHSLLFFNTLGLQVTNTVKDSLWEFWQYFSHLSAVTITKFI